MINRKSTLSLALAVALGAPLAAIADGAFVNTNDEAGSTIVSPIFGQPYRSATPTDTRPLAFGDISADRQYVYLGEGGGWQIRPMQYRIEKGALVHVDDPVGHMHRQADTSPLTPAQRTALRNSAG